MCVLTENLPKSSEVQKFLKAVSARQLFSRVRLHHTCNIGSPKPNQIKKRKHAKEKLSKNHRFPHVHVKEFEQVSPMGILSQVPAKIGLGFIEVARLKGLKPLKQLRARRNQGGINYV